MAGANRVDRLETVPCNLCGGEESVLLFLKDSFRIVKCCHCGLMYVNPRLTQSAMAQHYSEGYYTQGSYSDYLGERRGFERTFERRLRQIEKTIETGRILDVGCAYGFFLSVAEKRGWTAYGVDVSDESCRYAVEELGVRAACGTLEEASFQSDFFDVVIMNDTFEHLADPTSELLEVRRVLREDGDLFLVTQDAGRFLVRLLGKRWAQYKPREHLYYFTAATVQQMLRRAGFAVLGIADEGLVCTVDFLVGKLRNVWKPAGHAASRIVRLLGVGQVLVPVRTGYEVMIHARRIAGPDPSPLTSTYSGANENE